MNDPSSILGVAVRVFLFVACRAATACHSLLLMAECISRGAFQGEWWPENEPNAASRFAHLTIP